MNRINSLYTISKHNPKLSPPGQDVIVQYVGDTREESKASCSGCILLDPKPGEPKCYAHSKAMGWTHTSMIKAKKRGSFDYSLDEAMERTKKARLIRIGGIGDPSATNRSELKKISAGNIPVIGYTHFWETRGADLKDICMASVDSWEDADRAVAAGWRAFIWIVDYKGGPVSYSPAGNRAIHCVNQQNKSVTCQDCLLCVAGPKFETSAPIIIADYH